MFKVERIRRIKEIIFDRKQIEVATLSSLLNVSDATIRNDLEELEQQGYITRFHGGATLNSASTQEDQINQTLSGNAVAYDKNKEEIGVIAARLVNEKEWIFLGPGTTSYYIAKALVQRNNINVMTNNLLAAAMLSSNPSIRILLIGGFLNNEENYTAPDDINREFHDLYLSKAFFSVDGADLEAGYTLTDSSVMDLIRAVSARCDETVFSIDSTKFGRRSFMKVGDLDFAQSVITNDNTPLPYKKYYLEHGICIYTSYDLKPLTF